MSTLRNDRLYVLDTNGVGVSDGLLDDLSKRVGVKKDQILVLDARIVENLNIMQRVIAAKVGELLADRYVYVAGGSLNACSIVTVKSPLLSHDH